MKTSDFKSAGKTTPAQRAQLNTLNFCSDWKSAEEIAAGLELSPELVATTVRELAKAKLVLSATGEPKKFKTTASGRKWVSDFGWVA